MKTILSTLMLAAAVAAAQEAAPEATLKVGSQVKLDPVIAAEWVQGEAPKSFEPGKVYIFECWATWCGPCVAAIPHVNELYKKYQDKGLRVFGMNVWEDGKDKVEKFVKGKGDGMSYPVAYTGKGSAFENEWLKAAGVRGIPHAFVVKDGKILLMTHPAQLSESVIEALLSGEEGAKKALDEINAAQTTREKSANLMMAFRQAAAKNDVETMSAKLEELEKLDAKMPALVAMKIDLLVAKKEWAAATKAIDELPAGQVRQMSVTMLGRKLGMSTDGDYPQEFLKAVSKAYASVVEDAKGRTNPFDFVSLAYLQWKAQDKDGAVASANKAVEAAKVPGAPIPAAPLERFAKSLADGTLPTMQEFSGWLREAMPARTAPANPAPATPPPAKKE